MLSNRHTQRRGPYRRERRKTNQPPCTPRIHYARQRKQKKQLPQRADYPQGFTPNSNRNRRNFANAKRAGQSLSGAERIEPRKYAKQKEAEKAARNLSKKATEKAVVEVIKAIDDNEEKLLSSKEKSEYLEQLRKQYKDKGLSAEFFRELGVLKKDKETKYTQKELDEAIQKAVEADRKK